MVVILGLGFTGQRLARRLLLRNERVFAPVRGVERFADFSSSGVTLVEFASAGSALPKNSRLVHLIPPLAESENAALRTLIETLQPERVVYVSSTGVYGPTIYVNAETPVQPADERGLSRLREEQWIASHRWSTLILRSAAIYGPGRGVHTALRQGKLPRGAGSGVVSRVHVEDLAAIIEAGIFSGIEGAWPIADDNPCSTEEIVAWCCHRLGIQPPPANNLLIGGRRVDGTSIRSKLGIELKYSSWQTGLPASLKEEEEELRPR